MFPDELFTRAVWGAWPTIGAVIVARQPRNRIGWLCCAVGFLDEVDLDTLSAELLAVVTQTMEPTTASLWLLPPVEYPRTG
jgi:hypothetical protein